MFKIKVLFRISVLLICTAFFTNTASAVSLETTKYIDENCLLSSNEVFWGETTNVNDKAENTALRYKKALSEAQQLSDQMYQSKKKIFFSLTSRTYGFSDDEAQYAVDNIIVDWKKNALLKANSYERIAPWSKKRLYNQLTSDYGERFTNDEAQYAVDNVKADWKKNALEKGKIYMEQYGFSKRKVYNQLLYEGYTQEEVKYAIEHLAGAR